MDTLLQLTTPAVKATSPQLDIKTNQLSEDDILVASEYHGVAHPYSSEDDLCLSDHPSEDLSDLALAFRDESFSPAPQMVGRTYSSSGESFGMTQVEVAEDVVDEISRYANNIYGFGAWNVYGGSDEPNDEVEDEGYASLEDNNVDDHDIEAPRSFEAMDPVPTCAAQKLFVAAWNGATSSVGEDVADIETLPSDEESKQKEDESLGSESECGSVHTLGSEWECGSIHTLKSSEEAGQADAKLAQKTSGEAHIEMVITSSRCMTSYAFHSKDTVESLSTGETSLVVPSEDSVTHGTCFTKADLLDESGRTDIGSRIHFQQKSDTNVSAGKKQKVFKHLKKLFARFFGRK